MFIPLPDELLDDERCVTKGELELIRKSIRESEQVTNMCTDNDDDVLAYHEVYLLRIEKRLTKSMAIKRGLSIA
jgi:hypothetical protein